MRQRSDEGLDYRPRIGGGGAGKEAIWFAKGESNASKVEIWERAVTSLRSLDLRTTNQFSGWASLPTLVNELHDRQIRPFKFPEAGDTTKSMTSTLPAGISSHLPQRRRFLYCLEMTAIFLSSAPLASPIPH